MVETFYHFAKRMPVFFQKFRQIDRVVVILNNLFPRNLTNPRLDRSKHQWKSPCTYKSVK